MAALQLHCLPGSIVGYSTSGSEGCSGIVTGGWQVVPLTAGMQLSLVERTGQYGGKWAQSLDQCAADSYIRQPLSEAHGTGEAG
jgi:hypothetical protein